MKVDTKIFGSLTISSGLTASNEKINQDIEE